MTEKLRAFVIMPFDEEFNSIYENLIRDPLTNAGYEVTRADSLLNQENILKAIVRGITTADLVVADLTTNNPNVFYELGLAHALRIPTVLLAQAITDVPFDLRSYKIHIYDTHFSKIDKLRKFLKKLAEQHASKEIAFSNPVDDFAPEGESPQAPVARPDEVGDDNVGNGLPKELWDFIVEGEAAASELTTIINKLLKDNEAITARFKKHTNTLDILRQNTSAGSARRFHKVFLLAASDITNFAGKVNKLLPLLERSVDRVNENYSGFIQTVDTSTKEGLQTLKNLYGSIDRLLTGEKEAKEGLNSFKMSSLEIAELKLSKDLSRASRKQAEALQGVVSNLDRLEAFCAKALGMIEDKIDLDGTAVSESDDKELPSSLLLEP
jgi:nucleoside 2-deoxyribosyltransferase